MVLLESGFTYQVFVRIAHEDKYTLLNLGQVGSGKKCMCYILGSEWGKIKFGRVIVKMIAK